MSTNKAVSVPFEIVEIWHNGHCTPYTITPKSERSRKEYAIKIGDEFFHLGESGPYGNSLFICDYKYPDGYRGG